MAGFELHEHIDAPPAEVFALLADPTRGPEFIDNIVACEKLSDGPIAEGTTFRETRVVSGKEATADLVVRGFAPPTALVIGTEVSGIRVDYRYVLTPAGGGTDVAWTCELSASGFKKAMLPMVAGIMKKEDGNHLHDLKTYLEPS